MIIEHVTITINEKINIANITLVSGKEAAKSPELAT